MGNKFEIKDLNLYYGDYHALKNINMNLAENEITAFIGPSGCGKSTFLKCLNRMNDLVEGCKITGSVTVRRRRHLRKHGCQSVKKKSRYGIPEPESISNECL